MPVPTHREGCKTILYKTSCWDCHKDVWYFACSCGSVVLFDAAGSPWPEHRDSCPVYLVRLLLEEGYSLQRIRALVELEARKRGRPVPADTREFLGGLERAGRRVLLKALLPSEVPKQFTGLIYALEPVNFYRRFGFTVNPISTGILGNLVQEPYVELVLHQEYEADAISLFECSVFVPRRVVEAHGLRIGLAVRASLQMRDIVGDENQAFWVCYQLARVG